jgi:outer membrane protein TolC
MTPSSWLKAAFVAAFVVFPSAAAAADGPVPLGLNEAVIMAMSHNYDLRLARLTHAQAVADADAAAASFDPTLAAETTRIVQRLPNTNVLSSQPMNETDMTTGALTLGGLVPTGATYELSATAYRYGTNATYASLNPEYEVKYALSLTQPLLSGGGPTAARWAIVTAGHLEEAARLALMSDMEASVAAVHAAYWELVYRQGALTAEKEALDRAVDFLGRVEIQVEVGALPPIEVVAGKATVAERRRIVLEAENAASQAADDLLRLVNPPADAPHWRVGIVPSDDPVSEPVEIDVEAAVAVALDIRPDLKRAEALVGRAAADRDYYENKALPDLSLIGVVTGVGVRGEAVPTVDYATGEVVRSSFGGDLADASADATGGDAYDYTVGLAFTIPLGNRAPRAAAAKAAFAAAAARLTIDRTRRDVALEVREAARDVASGVKRVEAAKASRELAEERLAAELSKFEVGAATAFSALEYQKDLTLQRSQELAAVAFYRKAVARFRQATGGGLAANGVVFSPAP